MTNFKRLATSIDPSPILAELKGQADLWKQITVRQDFEGSPHAATESIFLRGPARLDNPLEELDCVDMLAIESLPATVDIIGQLWQRLGIRELGWAMLVNLKAGGVITPHTDEGAYARYYARFHYVLTSTPGCRFTVGTETVHMAPGEVWWFNHQIEHTVWNDGPDRLHLIFDAIVPGFVGALSHV